MYGETSVSEQRLSERTEELRFGRSDVFFWQSFHDFITEFYGSFSEKYFTCTLKKDIINKDLFRSENSWPVPVVPEEKTERPAVL